MAMIGKTYKVAVRRLSEGYTFFSGDLVGLVCLHDRNREWLSLYWDHDRY